MFLPRPRPCQVAGLLSRPSYTVPSGPRGWGSALQTVDGGQAEWCRSRRRSRVEDPVPGGPVDWRAVAGAPLASGAGVRRATRLARTSAATPARTTGAGVDGGARRGRTRPGGRGLRVRGDDTTHGAERIRGRGGR